ncbi:MAG: lipid A biosynthesis acyltransferase [Aquificae bacterium]|nr:lipid A biosynthesis acyltransferase [Aquificota bacterium]
MSRLILQLLFSYFKRLPREKAISRGEGLGNLLWKAGYRKSVIMRNLDIAFPERDKHWKEEIGRLSLQNIGRTLVEFPKLPEYVKSGEIDRIFQIEEGEELLREKGSKILITAHIGNWELGGAGLSYKYGNVVSLAYRIKNSGVNQLITEIRQKAGLKIIFHDQPLKDFVKAVREGKTLVFLADQNALRHRGVFVDFFSLPASTIIFPARLSIKYKVPILFAYQYFDYNTKTYRGRVKRIQTSQDIRETVQLYTKAIEEAVKEHPDQYFWVHKRWKTRPEGEPETVYSYII